jgi:hypothetical protein
MACFAASSGNFLPTFRGNLSVQASGVKNPIVPKLWQEITTTRCIIIRKNAVLIYFAAEA